MANEYIAFIHEDKAGGYSVSFPDIPGCNTCGDTLDEAVEMAADALSGWLALAVEAGEPIPIPSGMAALRNHPTRVSEYAIGAPLLVLVQADPDIFRPERVNVMIPRALLRRIDAKVSNRSRFLAEAAEAKRATL
jgi:predicted RNase H-like HicB family nuclease